VTVAHRVAEAAAGFIEPPAVTAEEYAGITCNRCGRCCEDIPAPESPEQMSALAADPAVDPDTRRFAAHLEAVGPIHGGWRYRCTQFERDADGLAGCGIFEDRPSICRSFPVGPIRRWTECAWYVRIDTGAPEVTTAVPVTLKAREARRLQAFYDGLAPAEREVFDALVRRAADRAPTRDRPRVPRSPQVREWS
jgi:Fe-S-cluster containining protein